MIIKKKFEPRMERAGLFSEEYALKEALKEINDRTLSYKRSTRGYTLLFNGKPANPVIAGKEKDLVKSALHKVHRLYVKQIASRDLSKYGYILDPLTDTDQILELVYQRNDQSNQRIKITFLIDNWNIMLEFQDFEENNLDFLNTFLARLGKEIS